VASTSLASIGYSPASSTLEVEYRTGAVYQFFAVPPSVLAALMSAPSKGTFVNQRIRSVYPYSRI
jgi:hypothetical protein